MKPSLHVISTGRQSIDVWLGVTVEIHPYVDFIHIREKQWSLEKAESVLLQLKKAGVPPRKIIFNNGPHLAAKFGLRGVHFPENVPIQQNDRNLLTGCSVHSQVSAIKKEKNGADYLFFGHIYKTNSKLGAVPRGLKSLKQAAQAVRCPVIAIGGITPARAKECINNGASGIAVMSGIYESGEPIREAKAYRRALTEEALHEESI
ncbi:thiamine phosphate synthase [Alteribacillus sp. JSM 102045]|uniref:thiamine phosphate synthase n=1 Tax=Alteribacillus sp. JSM 102045 TaxID=1562101 RepID=UPI0035BEDE43